MPVDTVGWFCHALPCCLLLPPHCCWLPVAASPLPAVLPGLVTDFCCRLRCCRMPNVTTFFCCRCFAVAGCILHAVGAGGTCRLQLPPAAGDVVHWKILPVCTHHHRLPGYLPCLPAFTLPAARCSRCARLPVRTWLFFDYAVLQLCRAMPRHIVHACRARCSFAVLLIFWTCC